MTQSPPSPEQDAAQLRELTRRLFDLREADRRQISRALHEDIGQTLSAVRMHLQSRSPNDPFGGVHEASETVGLLIERLRAMCASLCPTELEPLGLVPTLHAMAGTFARGVPIRIEHAQQDAHRRAAPEVEYAIYRVANEGVGNALRHASCTGVALRLSFDARSVALEITDDGAGFDVALALRDAATRGQVGLVCMLERCRQLSGRASIDSAPGRGTRIFVELPLEVPA